MRIIGLSLAVLILSATPTLALNDEGAGTTMAALADAKSECRFLLQLCDEAKAAAADVSTAQARAKVETDTNPGSVLIQLRAAADRIGRACTRLRSAGEVLKAKHDKQPACMDECGATACNWR